MELVALCSTWVYLLLTPWFMEFEQLFGAVAMLFAWLEMTLMLGRIPSIGMYTYMSTQVIHQLVKFFMVYMTSLFAFAIALHLLLARDYDGVFDNLWTTCLKVLMMMIGEYDFKDTFTWQKIKQSQTIATEGWFREVFPIFVQIVFIMLLFLVSIIIANLITGLTVNNIRELYKEAGVHKLGKTVEQITSSEEFMGGRLLRYAKMHFPGLLNTSLFARLRTGRNPDNILVCVEPNAIHVHDESIMKLVESENYEVYIYDEQHKTKSRLNMQLPSWIIRNTFEQLREKKKIQKELNESLQKNITVVQREYTSMHEELGTGKPRRQFSEMSSFPVLDQSPILERPPNDEIDLDLHVIGVLADKISNRRLSQFQKDTFMQKLREIESKLNSSSLTRR
eukprot:GFUD01002188.1.p1 GENE.GFUD01002188.1~~GFUD01002188.1.p1  ORF type:complete len:420 (+),score=70.79 GFUD01002188.1:79-1260(+)